MLSFAMLCCFNSCFFMFADGVSLSANERFMYVCDVCVYSQLLLYSTSKTIQSSDKRLHASASSDFYRIII